MANTFDFKEEWEKAYEVSHYLAPVYKAIADESMRGDLYQGLKLHRTEVGDFIVNDMGTTGTYTPQPWTETDEFLQINYAKEVSVTMKKQDLYMTHLPVAVKRAEKSMNRLFNYIDGLVFQQAQQNAGTAMDASYLSGQSSDVGVPITISQANIANIFFAANNVLIRNNVDYQPTGKWTGQYKIDKTQFVPVAIVDSNVNNYAGLYLGGKVTELGDRVTQNGFIGQLAGFNYFVSNALPFTVNLLLPVAPTNGDLITFMSGVTKNVNGVVGSQALTFKFVTSATNPGEITLSGTAATNAARLAAAMTSPYVSTISTNFVPFVQANLTIMQQMFLNQLTSVQNATVTTTVNIAVFGMGNIPLAATFVSGSNVFSNPAVHCLFGTSRSISLIMPRMAEIDSRPTPAYQVATDFIAWTYFGMKVFADQAPALIDVPISTTPFTFMANLTTN